MDSYGIVIADDHALFRQGLKRIIEDVGGFAVVGEAGDGDELLALLGKSPPDMVVLDMSMPKLHGMEAVRKIKADHPGVKILVLTMHREYMHQALSAGADGYMLKEDADRELFSAIENIRQGRVYLSPRLMEEVLTARLPSPDPITAREKEILKLIAEGKTNREIGEILFVSVRTVESHRASIIRKLDLKNTAELVRYAIQKGYV